MKSKNNQNDSMSRSMRSGKVRKRKSPRTDFHLYLKKLMKTNTIDNQITSSALDSMNSFILNMIDRFGTTAQNMMHTNPKKTLGLNEMIAAAKIIVPDGLMQYVHNEAMKKYKLLQMSYQAKKRSTSVEMCMCPCPIR